MNHEASIAETRGAYSAVFTPYDSVGAIDFDQLTRLIEFQLSKGVSGFFVAGSTGEGLLLSTDERNELVRHVVQVVSGRGSVIAHVGHPSTDVAVKLAMASASAGADWIASVGPIYYGTTFEGAKRHYGAISNATELPFMIYAIGQTVDPYRDQALFQLPNVCGMKYTGANFFSVQQLARRIDRPIALMSGFDEEFVASLSFGFQGGIGTTFNFAPGFYTEIYRLYHENRIDEAADWQARVNQVTQLMLEYENWTYRKAVMRYIGLDCGPCRLPFGPITDEQYEAFAARLDQLNVLQRGEANQRQVTP